MPNITSFFDNNALDSKVPALISPRTGETFGFPQFNERVMGLTSVLIDGGIKKGDRVCIFLDSSPEYLFSYFAIWRIGAIAVPANIAYREGELIYVVENSGSRAIIHDGVKGIQMMEKACVRLPGLEVEVRADLAGSAEYIPPAYCAFDDICQLQYTAGTTGRPKGAVLTHGNWMAALEAEKDVLELRKGDVYLGIYPMGHVGVSWGISVLRAGGTYVIMERFSEQEYLDLCRQNKVTVLAGMPPVIHGLCQAPPGTEEALRSVRVIISGGGQLLPSIWEEFDRRFHIPVANAYGLSETIVVGSGTATLPGNPALSSEYRSVGIPAGYTEIRIVDEGDPDIILPAGETGEIAIRGPSVARGYWNMPRESEEYFLADGWFLSGDVGHLDEHGILYITDRKKDMIIMSGWKIYPTEVENVILQHPKIADVAVFGVPDKRRGEMPVAAVVLKPGVSFLKDELEQYCRSRMAGYKIPRQMIVMDALPRVHGWKLLRRILKEEYSQGIHPGEDLS
ncbi:MAG TPA: AMP-binding protein [Methanoregulaceae archaeon]|nr:AMP-binding protein [Methanoregulaceae archaeon]